MLISLVLHEGVEYYNVDPENNVFGIPAGILSAALIEQAWGLVRAERARRIAATDYTQMPDSPLSTEQRQAFADYRQVLRDIPQENASPDAVTWPEPPALS